MKNKIFAAALAAALALSLTACGKDDGGGSAPTFLTSGTGAAEASQTVKPQSSAPSAQSKPEEQSGDPAADDKEETEYTSGGTIILLNYSGGIYEWTSDEGDVVKRIAVHITDNGEVELQFDDDQKYASYNSLSEAGTYTPIVYVMSGDIAGEAAFKITLSTVAMTYKFDGEEITDIYKRVE